MQFIKKKIKMFCGIQSFSYVKHILAFLGGSDGKNSAYNARD